MTQRYLNMINQLDKNIKRLKDLRKQYYVNYCLSYQRDFEMKYGIRKGDMIVANKKLCYYNGFAFYGGLTPEVELLEPRKDNKKPSARVFYLEVKGIDITKVE